MLKSVPTPLRWVMGVSWVPKGHEQKQHTQTSTQQIALTYMWRANADSTKKKKKCHATCHNGITHVSAAPLALSPTIRHRRRPLGHHCPLYISLPASPLPPCRVKTSRLHNVHLAPAHRTLLSFRSVPLCSLSLGNIQDGLCDRAAPLRLVPCC
jgi:hypothetical protein